MPKDEMVDLDELREKDAAQERGVKDAFLAVVQTLEPFDNRRRERILRAARIMLGVK